MVITLLLLFLMSVVGLAAVLTSGSDILINGYYRNFRGSFYAADSGLAIARQQLVNQVVATVPATFTAGTAPIPTSATTTAINYINTTYGNPCSLAGGDQSCLNPSGATANTSWSGYFKILNPTFGLIASPTQPQSFTNSSGSGYTYTYNYTLTSLGSTSLGGNAAEQSTVTESGNIIITAIVTPAGPQTVSFAAYGMFIDQQTVCNGSTLVPGTITGPVFTNGAWTFGTGSYTFTDKVGQVAAQAGFQNGNCNQSSSGANNGISPNYQGGYQWGQNAVPLPANSYNQKLAVWDGVGACPTGTTCPTAAQVAAHPMAKINGTAYSASSPSNGVYMPYQSISGTNTVTGGGIMIQGDAAVTLTTGNATGEPANTQQIITVVQGGTTTTITIDPQTNTTKMVSGATTLVLAGVPTNCSTMATPPSNCTAGLAGSSPATMVYDSGNITSLSGPSSGAAAIANGSAMTVSSASDMTITGDLQYVADPVTLTASSGTPIDSLVPANNTGQVLGLFTATGQIKMQYPDNNGNHEIDASIAAISAGGSGGLENTGNAINNLTIVGGRIQSTIENINASTRNVLFDKRFASGFAPPWFPATTITPSNSSAASLTPSVSRVQWVSNSSE